MDSGEHRVWRGHIAQCPIERECLAVQFAGLIGKFEQRLHFGREPELAGDLGPEQRLLTGAVAREQESFARLIPHRQSEHAVESRDRVGSMALVERHDCFDVAGRPKRVAPRFRFTPQVRRVIDLAVAHHPNGAVGTLERLITGGEIHDREAARPDARALVSHDAFPVWSAVPQRRRHARQRFRMAQHRAARRYGSEDAAHGPYAA